MAKMSAMELEMEKATRDGEVVLGGAGDEEEEEEDVVLPGYRFHPTDEELVTFYLRRKVARKSLSIEVIREMDIYKHDPWDLPKASTVGGEKEWYFFCLRGRKYRNSIRPNRVTGSGFWKATGIDRPIYSAAAGGSGSGVSIGLKKSLVYYRGSAGKGTKTDWMMHEFRLPPAAAAAATNSSPSMQEAEVWTICRIFRRNITYRKQQQQQPQQTWRPAPAVAAADSSSNTGSFESSEGGDKYMNCLQAPAAAAPCIPQHQHQQHYVSQTGTVDSANFFYRDTMHNQQFQGGWSASPGAPVHEQKPQNPLSTADSFQQNDHSLAVAANDFYKVEALEGYLEEIARMMEVNDPAGIYDYRSYGSSAGNRGPSFVRALHSPAP